MNLQTLVVLVVLALFVWGYYATHSKRHKLLCHFTGRDRTEEDKWVNLKSEFVIFREFKFRVLPDRITSFWMTSGIHFFFPTRVNYAKFSWYGEYPHDPNRYNIAIVSPEVRKAMNKEEWVRSYAKGFTPPSTKKQSMLQAFLPMIAIGLIVIVGFYLYMNQQALAHQLALIQNTLKAITK